nr:MAG TPA: hypothetical protein [Caudoviricetes sp.]
MTDKVCLDDNAPITLLSGSNRPDSAAFLCLNKKQTS